MGNGRRRAPWDAARAMARTIHTDKANAASPDACRIASPHAVPRWSAAGTYRAFRTSARRSREHHGTARLHPVDGQPRPAQIDRSGAQPGAVTTAAPTRIVTNRPPPGRHVCRPLASSWPRLGRFGLYQMATNAAACTQLTGVKLQGMRDRSSSKLSARWRFPYHSCTTDTGEYG